MGVIFMKKKVSAFIFDMDGTLVDNMSYHQLAWAGMLKHINLQSLAAEDIIHKFSGEKNEDIFNRLLNLNLSPTGLARMAEKKERIYRKLYKPHLRPVDGVVCFLKKAHSFNISTALATAAYKKNMRFILGGLEIKKYFKATVNAEEVTCGKPDPELFLLAAKKLGVDPSECIVFEDSLKGVEGARRAGMKAVFLKTSVKGLKLEEEIYKHVILEIDNYCNLEPESLLNFGVCTSKDLAIRPV